MAVGSHESVSSNSASPVVRSPCPWSAKRPARDATTVPAVFPLVVGLRQWGERYLFEAGETRSALVDAGSGQGLEPLQVRSLDGRMLNPEDCVRKVVRHG